MKHEMNNIPKIINKYKNLLQKYLNEYLTADEIHKL